MYYLRSKPATDAIKFTVDIESLMKESEAAGHDVKMFNKQGGEEDATLGKRDALETEVQSCPLRPRRRKGQTK